MTRYMLERLCDEFISAAEKNNLWSREKETTSITCQKMHLLLKVIRQILPQYIVRDKNSHQLIPREQAEKRVFDRFMQEMP
ncbi:MAG: hypothetical protein AAFO95_15120 [Cyanobacteria bacterium J06600_6]